MGPFRFGVHTSVAPSMSAWRDRARTAEDLGYAALYVPDHFNAQFGPLVAATVAAEATSTLHVGTQVLNNDLRHPVVLAREMATLCLAAEGRVEVGLGAGWLRRDYEELGIDFDRPGVRVDRLAESLRVMKELWTGEETTFSGKHYTVRGARCSPHPETAPRLIVGGGSRRVLTVAAEQADIVGVNPNMASGETGGDPAGKVTFDHYDRCLQWVREAAGDRFDSLEIQILTFTAMVVANRRAAVRTAALLGFQGEEALELPVLLIGTVDEMCERLLERRERWGFSNVVVPGEAMETFAPVVSRLSGV